MELERDQFEEVALAHFVAQRAAGVQISGDNGCEPTRESLFWRTDEGDYGVRMFNAAWWGWKEAAVATRKTCEVPTLDEAAMARLAEIDGQPHIAWKHDDFDHAVFQQNCPKYPESGWHNLYAAAGAPLVATPIVAWAKSTPRKLRITTMDMGREDGWRPLGYTAAGASPQQSPLLQFCTCEDCKPMECEGCRINRERRELLPAPSDTAITYMTGYSDGREWAQPSQAVELSDEEQVALLRFNETCEDGQGYDVKTSMMSRLAEIGVVSRKFGSVYFVTEYGQRVIAAINAKGSAT